MIVALLSSDCPVTAGWLPSDCRVTAWLLPGDCQVTAGWLPGEFQVTILWLSVDCSVTVQWLPSDCPVTVLWLPSDCLLAIEWLSGGCLVAVQCSERLSLSIINLLTILKYSHKKKDLRNINLAKKSQKQLSTNNFCMQNLNVLWCMYIPHTEVTRKCHRKL